MTKRLWILGAADPEMAAIETLLSTAGEAVAYATVNGDRVHPGNAYRATAFSVDGESRDAASGTQLIFVECHVTLPIDHEPDPLTVDHHRPGDPGWGKPASEYWSASSIGQTVEILGISLADAEGILGIDPLLIAAADHCLAAAYRGECPGVDPDELMVWRAKSRAAFQGRPVEDVLRDVEAARTILRHCVASGSVDYADLRGRSIPELPEAAAREGIPFLASVKDPDGREKVILQAASTDLVRQFLAGEICPGLIDTYGDPARGFAGGYSHD